MSATAQITFDTVCKQVTSDGVVQSSSSNALGEIGYPYRDVVKKANGGQFTYVSSSPETEFIEPASSMA
jgi:hypothetical protein